VVETRKESLANDVQSAVIHGAGHWFAEQAPEETVAALSAFLAPYREASHAPHAGPRRSGRDGTSGRRYAVSLSRRLSFAQVAARLSQSNAGNSPETSMRDA